MVGFGPSSYTKITTAFVLYEFLVGSVTWERHPKSIEKQMKFVSSKSEINVNWCCSIRLPTANRTGIYECKIFDLITERNKLLYGSQGH